MKSAGNCRANRCSSSHGQWYCAKGIAPESNQTSITSRTRRMRSPHFGHAISTSSTHGRCRSSSPSGSVTARSRSSSMLPIASTASQAPQRQTFSGVPQ